MSIVFHQPEFVFFLIYSSSVSRLLSPSSPNDGQPSTINFSFVHGNELETYSSCTSHAVSVSLSYRINSIFHLCVCVCVCVIRPTTVATTYTRTIHISAGCNGYLIVHEFKLTPRLLHTLIYPFTYIVI